MSTLPFLALACEHPPVSTLACEHPPVRTLPCEHPPVCTFPFSLCVCSTSGVCSAACAPRKRPHIRVCSTVCAPRQVCALRRVLHVSTSPPVRPGPTRAHLPFCLGVSSTPFCVGVPVVVRPYCAAACVESVCVGGAVVVSILHCIELTLCCCMCGGRVCAGGRFQPMVFFPLRV